MASATVKLNYAGFVTIANKANEQMCQPLGQQVASMAGGGYRVDKWTRVSKQGWGRTRVWTDSPEAYRREYKTGALARALGSL